MAAMMRRANSSARSLSISTYQVFHNPALRMVFISFRPATRRLKASSAASLCTTLRAERRTQCQPLRETSARALGQSARLSVDCHFDNGSPQEPLPSWVGVSSTKACEIEHGLIRANFSDPGLVDGISHRGDDRFRPTNRLRNI